MGKVGGKMWGKWRRESGGGKVWGRCEGGVGGGVMEVWREAWGKMWEEVGERCGGNGGWIVVSPERKKSK